VTNPSPKPPAPRRSSLAYHRKWISLAAFVCGTCYYTSPECFVVLARIIFDPLGTR